MTFRVPENLRVRRGPYASSEEFGRNGMFMLMHKGLELKMVCSDQLGWDHVSVTINRPRCPSWEIMCFVKDLFWTPDDTVVQFHPRAEEYVNHHPHCLHLWRKQNEIVELPPSFMVGPK